MMHFYPFFINEYAVRTSHLDLIEDLVYRRMIDLYYLRDGEPLPEAVEIARLIRMKTHLAEVEAVLHEFFLQDENGGWRHSRCDREVAKMLEKQEKARASGRASAARKKELGTNERSTNVQPTLNERTTDVERTYNERSTNVERTYNERTTDVERTLNERTTDAQLSISISISEELSTNVDNNNPLPPSGEMSPTPSPDHSSVALLESLWALYPKRPGNSRPECLRALKARLKSGVSPEAILRGVAAYQRYCTAEKTEPRFIKTLQVFLGPSQHYASDWTVTQPRGTHGTATHADNSAPAKVARAIAERDAQRTGQGVQGDDVIELGSSDYHAVPY